ncbi:MAG: CYTH domain-containing protein [Spirochaetia bacterium]|nr:CYTH domain-containing protein [Spirochaetia bacterium]
MELEAKFELLKKSDFKLPEKIAFYETGFFAWPLEIANLQEKYPPEIFLVQHDIYHDDDKAALKNNDRVLRNRRETLFTFNEKNEAQKKTRNLITYKGGRQKSKYKLREEIEFEINPLIWNVFDNLGFQKTMSVKKFRWISRIQKEIDVSLCFDLVENLGAYLEVETALTEDTANHEEKFTRFLKEENLTRYKIEKEPYTRLLS